MDAVTLGMTGLSVSPIAFGTELHLDEHALERIARITTGAVAFTGPAPELMPTS